MCTPYPGHHATPDYVTNCSAHVQHGLYGHWSSKQHLQCTKLHCRRRQLLQCGLRALMALNSMTAQKTIIQYFETKLHFDFQFLHPSTASFISGSLIYTWSKLADVTAFHAPDPAEGRIGAPSFGRRSPFLSFPALAFSAVPFRSWVVTANPVFGLIGCRTEWLANTEKLRPVAMFNNSTLNTATVTHIRYADSCRSLVNFCDRQHQGINELHE